MSKYNEIVSFILNQVACSKIKPGQKLPTVREIAEKFDCSKVTVVKAYDELQKHHVIYSVPKSGFYLVQNSKGGSDLDPKIINFSSAAPDCTILPYEEFQHCLNQAIQKYQENLFNYANAKGLPSLVHALVNLFQDYQIFPKPDQIIITAGAQQAINILCQMPFPNGKTNVLIEQPTYNGALQSLKLNQISAIGIERSFDGINLAELERKFANGNVKFFYTMPRFHNPLGTSYSSEEKQQILKLANQYDVYIVEDDYLADLEIQKNSYSLLAYDQTDRVIYLKSFSKTLLPGLRIAAVILPKLLVSTFEKYKTWTDLGTSVLSQGALEIYIKSEMFKAHSNSIKKIYIERMTALQTATSALQLSFIQWHIPATGFFACLEFLDDINKTGFINHLSHKNIQITDMSSNYIKAFLNDKLIKLSISKTNSNEIQQGASVLLTAIQNIKPGRQTDGTASTPPSI